MPFKVGHVNVRSLIPKFDNFRDILIEGNYDCMGVTETWTPLNFNLNLLRVEGYRCYHLPRGTRGGGVAVYVKIKFNFNVFLQEVFESIEHLWIRLQLFGREVIFGVIYRPDNNFNSFLSKFEDALSSAHSAANYVMCVGDFNINGFNILSPACSRFTNCIETFLLQQIINEPTRVTPYSSTLIDYIITQIDIPILASGVIVHHNLADHFLVYCIVDFKTSPDPPVTRRFRNYHSFNYNNFILDLNSIFWDFIYYLDDIDQKVAYFNEKIVSLFDYHAPYVTRRFKTPHKPWITDNVKLLISLREKAFKRSQRTGVVAHWEYYKELRNYTTYVERQEKKAYLEWCCRTSHPKELWKSLRDIGVSINKKTHSSLPPDVDDPNALNDFFCSNQSNSPPNQEILNFYNNNVLENISNTFDFKEVKEDEIFKALNSCCSQAVGSDGVSIKMIKLCCPFLLPYIEHIFNFCIARSVFPSCWKLSNVVPLPKKSNPTGVSDLRPISILSVLGKTFEKLISVQIQAHLNNFDIIPGNQSGFRAGFSCVSALNNVVDDVLRASDVGEVSVLVLLDFSRAFDTINHNILLAILHYIGFSNKGTAMISNFLLHRFQRVVISGEFSNYNVVKSGVPQGSVLGPLLFAIYTSQLVCAVEHCKIHMYADDTQIYKSFSPSELQHSQSLIVNDIKNLICVSSKHNLNINPTKSTLMLLGSRQCRERVVGNVEVTVDNVIIPLVNEAKNLGVWFDSDLRFKKHISSSLQKSYSALKMLYSNRHLLNTHLKKFLCDSLVLSNLNYGDTLYHYCIDAADRSRIQRLQNSCLRFIYGLRKRDRISQTLQWAGWLDMSQRRFLHTACFYHRVLFSRTPPYLHNKIRYRTDVHNLNLRHRHTLTIPKHNLELFKRSFTYNITSVCNSLPSDLLSMPPSVFKSRMIKLLFKNELLTS